MRPPATALPSGTHDRITARSIHMAPVIDRRRPRRLDDILTTSTPARLLLYPCHRRLVARASASRTRLNSLRFASRLRFSPLLLRSASPSLLRLRFASTSSASPSLLLLRFAFASSPPLRVRSLCARRPLGVFLPAFPPRPALISLRALYGPRRSDQDAAGASIRTTCCPSGTADSVRVRRRAARRRCRHGTGAGQAPRATRPS